MLASCKMSVHAGLGGGRIAAPCAVAARDWLETSEGGVIRSKIWDVSMDATEALSVFTTAFATSSLKRCRPMMRSSRVPRVSSRYTFTVRVCPSLCARSMACMHHR